MYIGNIVVSSANIKVDSCYKKCLTMDEIDNNLPTLIIGLQNAKKNINSFNILEKTYGNVWWTFSKTEKRIDYDKDMELFYQICISKCVEKMNYKFIDIMNIDYGRGKKLLKYIKNSTNKHYYIDNNKFIFLYDEAMPQRLWGFSLNTAAFCGLSKRKIISTIANNEKNRRIKNFYSIPNTVKRLVKNDIPSEMVLLRYFID